ncbi:MAG: hypothetical protein JWQ42_867 [Edaphobacter sp.]|nr:hypothetical protein [Edaphobacter sp.]
MRGGGVELAGVGLLEAADVARVLDAGGLHTQADAEVGNALFAGVADGVEHALDASLAKAAGDEDAVEVFQLVTVFEGRAAVGVFGLEAFGFDPGDAELEVVGQGAVDEGFLEGLIAVLVLDVLADDADGDLVLGVVSAVDDVLPLGDVGGLGLDAEVLEGEGVYAFGGEGEGDLVDAGDVAGGDDGGLLDVAEEGDLAAHLAGDGAVGAAEEDVGLDADGEHLLDGVLGGLGLELLGGGDPGNEGDVDEDGVVAAEILAHLADGFEEGEGLDVAYGAADLDDGDFCLRRDLAHGVLYLVSDVGDDLDGLAEVVAAALLGNDLLVDAAGGEVVVTGEFRVGETLVVAEVEVGLGAVVGDEDLAVLEGRHGAGIDVEIGVKLHEVDLDAAGLQQAANRGCGETLAE